ncbi:MAG: hypothetical protein IKD47_01245 [Clostridia bacterium]|nr:hypothetical protein [Clostridia bacterium]
MMTSVYNDADLLSVYKQRKKTLGVFWAVTLVYAAFCIAWLIYHISLPYGSSMDILPKIMVYVVTALYVIFIFPFMGIRFSRVNRYYKALVNFSEGLKSEEKNYFYCFEKHSLQKDNIDVTYCVFESWSKKRKEWMDREVYFDVEKPLPDFGSGDHVLYVTQSNFILQYDVLERGVFEFEEVDDEEEYEELSEKAAEETEQRLSETVDSEETKTAEETENE